MTARGAVAMSATALLLALLLLAGHVSAQETPAVSSLGADPVDEAESEGLQAKTIALAEKCVGKEEQYLVGNLTKCSVTDVGSPNLPVDVFFMLEAIDDVREFDIFMSLRTSVGGVTMSLKFNPDPSNKDSEEVTLYSTRVTDPSEMGMLTITRENLAGGLYQVHIETTTPTSRFTLRVFTPTVPITMDPADVAAIKEIYHDCCPQQGMTSQLCQRLQNAISPTRVPEADLCNAFPNMCTNTGRLFRLVLRPDSTRDLKPLQCVAGKMPFAALSKLDALQFLDLTHNGLGGTVDELAAALEPLTDLDAIFLNNNTISGELNCDLIQQNPIKVLRLRRNQITGTIPDCYMASPNLTTLDLSRNSLEGSIPEVTGTIPLLTLNLRNQSGEVGLSGPLPANLASARELLNLDIVDNSIEGTIPVLPDSLEVAYLDGNYLEGTFPSTANLANITFFTASNNKLSGPLPAGIFAAQFIQAIDLSNNSLSGSIDALPWGQILEYLTWIDLSWNQLTGTLPALPLASEDPTFQVTSILLAGNKLSGNLDKLAASIPPPDNNTDPAATPEPTNPIIRLDLSDNQLTGTVPAQLAYLSTFNGFIDGWGSQGIPPMLDLSNNELTGSFPMWVYPSLIKSSNSPLDAPYVDFGGNPLQCPPPGTVTDLISAYQSQLNLTCYDAATGDQVDVLEALKGTNGDRSKGGSTLSGSKVSSSSAKSRSASDSDSSKDSDSLSAGVIAGIVVGCLVGACVLAVLGALIVKKVRKPKKPYQDVDEPTKVALPRLPQSTFVGPESNIV